uniref:Uncharacterized protein n=1 Tax=Meleagris gallopavo TaxID=9103 RepID=A0A803YSB9_MELGA
NLEVGWVSISRWTVPQTETCSVFSFFQSKDKMMRGSRRGCVRLRGAVIGIDDEDDSTFTITVDQKTFHFQGELTEEIVFFSCNRFHLYLMDDFKCLATEQRK